MWVRRYNSNLIWLRGNSMHTKQPTSTKQKQNRTENYYFGKKERKLHVEFGVNDWWQICEQFETGIIARINERNNWPEETKKDQHNQSVSS